MLRKLVIWSLAAALLISMLPLLALAETPDKTSAAPVIQGEAGFLLDMKSGKVLYSKNENERLYPASITKIMTAILALERSKLDEQVTTSKLAREQEGNRVYLAEGESQSMENMLYGLMLNSGNDAAIAIAEHVGGSVQGFADLMNQKAKELGANDTHFVTPNGLHDPEHYTTAHDITLIAKYAMQNPKFREIVKTETREWHGKEWESVLSNINPMLYNYDGATGVKTGFTDQAEQTMVFSAARGDRELIGAVMKAQTKPMIRLDATALLDYGFDQFVTTKLADRNQTVSSLKFKDDLQTDVKAKNDFWYTYKKGEQPNIQPQVKLQAIAKPPVKAGSEVGKLEFVSNGQTVGTVPLVAVSDVAPLPVLDNVTSSLKWWYTLLPVPLFFVGLIYRRFRIRTSQVQSLREYKNQNYF